MAEKTSYDRELGALQADMKNTNSKVDDLKQALKDHAANSREQFEAVDEKLTAIISTLDRANGGWRMLAIVGTIAGGVGAVTGKALLAFFK